MVPLAMAANQKEEGWSSLSASSTVVATKERIYETLKRRPLN